MVNLKFVFGPVPSRRFGNSLGVEIIPPKVCNFDCIYCECGKTITKLGNERRSFVKPEWIFSDLEQFFKNRSNEVEIDVITITGSGEPTLHKDLGLIAKYIKEHYPQYPLVLLTNSSLLWREDVLEDIRYFDIIAPSFDAVWEDIYEKINRPERTITLELILKGLEMLGEKFPGKIYLESLFVKGINDGIEHVRDMGKFVRDKMRVDVWYIGTVDRPPAETFATPLTDKELENIKNVLEEFFYPVVVMYRNVDIEAVRKEGICALDVLENEILNILARRPCTIEDLTKAFPNCSTQTINHTLQILERKSIIETVFIQNKKFFKIINSKIKYDKGVEKDAK